MFHYINMRPVLVVIMTSIRVDDFGVTLVGLVISCVRFKLEHKLVSTLDSCGLSFKISQLRSPMINTSFP